MMKLEAPMAAIFPLLGFVLLLNALSMNSSAVAQSTPFPIRVGVVLDMDDSNGKMGLKCITMALSDFYSRHSYYQTRLILHKRDSKRDVVGAAAAALDLLINDEVQAIIGPLSTMQANFMINLGDKAHVPIITFSASSPSLLSIQSPYFVRAALSDSSQVKAIAAIIQAFGWKEVVPIYVDNEFGEGILPYLADALEQINVRIPSRIAIPSSATDDQIVAKLNKLMTIRTTVFIVHMSTGLGSRLFRKAEQLGMMSEDYVWIITDGMANELNSINPSVMAAAMQGVIGVRPHIPETEELDNFRIQYKKELCDVDLNIFGLWAYDSAEALAMAVEKARIRNTTFLDKANISTTSTDLEGFGVSGSGGKLLQALSSTTFRGLTGDFKLVEGQLQSPPYEIVNVIGVGPRIVGYWKRENVIVRELNSTKSSSKWNIAPIIWPGDTTIRPKGWVTNGKKLRIGVPAQNGFSEFINVTWNSNNSVEVVGYSKEVFDMVVKALPYRLRYEYVPFATTDHKAAGTYDALVYAVFQGKFDAAVGDITIIANRSKYVDFTLPYKDSSVSMVLRIKNDKSKKAWVFLKPLTWKLWLTSLCSFVLMGFLIWILEHRINEEFRGPLWHQVGTIFYFAFSTMVFAHKERVVSSLSRFLLIIWFLVVFILTQSYTASLTSMLTVQRLQTPITVDELIRNKEYVGYHEGSFVFELLRGMNFNESRLLSYKSFEEMDELFRKGSANGGIAAAFDGTPFMKLFLTKYCSSYIMVGPIHKTDGLGFVFPKGSLLAPDISTAILNVTEGEKMMEIEKRWFGNENKCADSSNLPSSDSLGLESFWGLFMIVGIAGVFALTIYVISFLHENWHVVHHSDTEATLRSKSLELFQKFNNKDLTCHTFKNTERIEFYNGCRCDCARRVMEPPNEHLHPSASTFSLNSAGSNGPPSPISSSPEAYSMQFRVEQDAPLMRHEVGESNVIEQDIELVHTYQNQFSVNIRTRCKKLTKAVGS